MALKTGCGNKNFSIGKMNNHCIQNIVNLYKRKIMRHMKRNLTVLILLISSAVSLKAQWNDSYYHDGKNDYFPNMKNLTVFNPDYYWQNEHLWDYDVNFYFIDLSVSPLSTFVTGSCTIGATAVTQIDTFAFELIPEQTIDSIFVDNVKYTSFTRDGNNILVPVSAIGNQTAFDAKIYYHGQPPSGGFFSGITHKTSPTYNKEVTWTLSEPFAAKDWFPVKQDLQDKADSAWIFLTTDTAYMAGSEGVLENVTELGNGKHRFEWKEHHPIDYYLLSFSVSDYQDYSIYAHPSGLNGDSVLIQNFIYDDPSCLQVNKNAIDETAEILELYSDLFITYPFSDEKYGHCLTELGGGMEHQTMTTIGGFNFHLVSHELGHMWFGDNVTCATWSDIWINEGFATYSNYLAEEKIHGWNAAQTFIISTQNNAMGDTLNSIYIPEDEIFPGNEWRIFDGRLSYDKGASIIHMLRHEIGDDSLFFSVLSTFQTQFSDSTATGDDFKNVAENVTGMDFDYFFDQWYYGKGYPIYNFNWYWSGGVFHLTSTQTSTSHETPLFDMLMDYKLKFGDGSDTVIQLRQTANLNVFDVPVEKEVVNIVPDPDNWTLEKTGSIVSIPENIDNTAYFTIGPVPVKTKINIYFENNGNNNHTVKITDVSGKVLIQKEFRGKSLQIDLSSLPEGIFFISSTAGTDTVVKRFVKI
jgi:aminopeptidase N